MMEITKELFDTKVHETMNEIEEVFKKKDDGSAGVVLLLFFTLGVGILRNKIFSEEEAKEE